MADLNSKKEKNINFFKKHLKKFLEDKLLKDKFIVIHEQKIQKSFDTFGAAINYATEHFPPEEFVIQQVVDESEQISFLVMAA